MAGTATHFGRLMTTTDKHTRAMAAATNFLDAFDRLEWDSFSRFIAPEASVFLPFPDAPRRLDGKAAILAAFAPFFARIRQVRPGPSFLAIKPQELTLQLLGDVALVTFHLNDGQTFSRRTAIFEERPAGWLLIHLHASNVALP